MCGSGSRHRPSLQTCECSHPSEWSFSLQSSLRSAAGRLLSGCQRRPEQRHRQQSFTRRASVWGEGRERERPPHAHTGTRTRRNLLQAPSSAHPNADFFFFLSSFFFPFLFGRTKTLGWVGAVVFPGLLSVDGGEAGGGGGSRDGLNARKVPNFHGRVAEIVCAKLREGKTGEEGGGGNN